MACLPKQCFDKCLQLCASVLELYIRLYLSYDPFLLFVQSQTQQTENHIREEFEQLRQFLQNEEEARIAILQEEDEQKRHLVRKKAEGITADILTLSHAIIAIDNDIASSDALFLQVRRIGPFINQQY